MADRSHRLAGYQLAYRVVAEALCHPIHSPIGTDKDTQAITVKVPSEALATETASALFSVAFASYMRKQFPEDFARMKEEAWNAKCTKARKSIGHEMYVACAPRYDEARHELKMTLDLSVIPGWEEADSKDKRLALLSEYFAVPLKNERDKHAKNEGLYPVMEEEIAGRQYTKGYRLHLPLMEDRPPSITPPPVKTKKKAAHAAGQDKISRRQAQQNQADAAKEAAQKLELEKAREAKRLEVHTLYKDAFTHLDHPPHALKERAEILSDTITTLAAALDTRSDKTLELIEASEPLEFRVRMERELAGILLSKPTLKRAANALDLPKAFGKWSDKEEEQFQDTAKANRHYFAHHFKAREFLMSHAKENPGLLLLLRAALQHTVSHVQMNEHIAGLTQGVDHFSEHKGECAELFVLPQTQALFDAHYPPLPPVEPPPGFAKKDLRKSLEPRALGESRNTISPFTRR